MKKTTLQLLSGICLCALVPATLLRGASAEVNQSSQPPSASSTTPNCNSEPPSYMTGNWGGTRTELENEGVTFTPTYTTEVFGNPSGGMRRGVVNDGLLNMVLDLDLDKLTSGALSNTIFHVNALYAHGANLSGSFVGDFAGTSNIMAYNSLRLQELWVEKSFWDKRLSLKVGNMAVDTEFFQSCSSSLFINGTFGAPTLIANNVDDVPAYPVASPGVRLMLQPIPEFYAITGVYGMDMNSEPSTTNQNGTRFAFNAHSGMLIMSEVGYLLNQGPNDKGLQGSYRLGSFVHTANYTTWDSQAQFANGTGPLRSAGADFGIYGVLDQQIYSDGDQAISFFVRSGGAPSNTNFVDYYVDGGFNFTGFIPGRKNDVAGIAVARSHVSDSYSDAQVLQGSAPSSAETVIEATYKVQLSPCWSVQPDVQYIFTPSGVEGSRNATVLGVRTSVTF